MTETMDKELKLDYTITKRVVEISNFRLNGFEKLMKNIKRISKYLGLPAPKMTDLGTKMYYGIKRCDRATIGLYEEYSLDHSTITTDYNMVKKIAKPVDMIVQEEVNVFEIEIIEEIIPDNEWRILGVIDHTEGIIKSAPNRTVPFNLIPSDLEGSCDCDHCNTKRRRNKTIYVENTDNNEIKRVGGTCIKYYLGYDYEKVLGFITVLNLFNESDFGFGGWDESEGDFGGRYIDYADSLVDVSEVVKYFFWFVNNKGYTSKAAANAYNEKVAQNDGHGSKESTSDTIKDYIELLNTPPQQGKYYEEDLKFQREEISKFNEIIKTYTNDNFEIIQNFIEERYMENNFLVNSRNFFNNGVVKIKHLKFVLAACSMYYGLKMAEERKKQQNEAFAKAGEASTHVGTVGEKSQLINLKITNVSGFDSGYGWTNIYKLEDEKGNIYTKFGKLNEKFITPESEVKDLEKGAILSFTSDIKKHDEYKGVKQTIIGRISKLK